MWPSPKGAASLPPAVAAIGLAVVGHHPLDADTVAGGPGGGAFEKPAARLALALVAHRRRLGLERVGPVKRCHRRSAIAATRASGFRCGQCCGTELGSLRAAIPATAESCPNTWKP